MLLKHLFFFFLTAVFVDTQHSPTMSGDLPLGKNNANAQIVTDKHFCSSTARTQSLTPVLVAGPLHIFLGQLPGWLGLRPYEPRAKHSFPWKSLQARLDLWMWYQNFIDQGMKLFYSSVDAELHSVGIASLCLAYAITWQTSSTVWSLIAVPYKLFHFLH